MKPLRVRLRFVEFPPTHTCDGPDTSPEIGVGDLDAEALAVMALNPFEPCCSFTAWLIWMIARVGQGSSPAMPTSLNPAT